MPHALHSFQPSLLAAAVQILRLSLWLILLAAIFTPLERLFAIHPREALHKGLWTDIGFFFLSSFVASTVLSVPLAAVAWAVHHLLPSAIPALFSTAPLWARILLSFLIGEFGFYWGHRWTHEHPLLWRFHAVHHAPEHLNYLVSTRSHPVDMIFTRLCGLVPLYILGLAAPARGSASLIPVLIVLLGTVWGFFIHSNVRWRFGPLEWLIATPAFHHWHHTNDGEAYINKNYAPMLPGVDRLFGTLYLPRDRRPERYGIDAPTAPTLIGQLIEPFQHRPETSASEPTK